MANWHFVMPYDDAAADWLAQQGYPHSPARAGNRLPSWAEVEQVVRRLGLPADAPLVVDLAGDGETLKVRGDMLLELRVVRGLCDRCGQLWVYPDCGSPAILIEASSSPEAVAAAWEASLAAEDSWRAFHERTRSASQGTLFPGDL